MGGIDEAALKGALMVVERAQDHLTDLMCLGGYHWGAAAIAIAGDRLVIKLRSHQRVFPSRKGDAPKQRINEAICHTFRGAEAAIREAEKLVKHPRPEMSRK